LEAVYECLEALYEWCLVISSDSAGAHLVCIQQHIDRTINLYAVQRTPLHAAPYSFGTEVEHMRGLGYSHTPDSCAILVFVRSSFRRILLTI
jgi:hypothetical protein